MIKRKERTTTCHDDVEDAGLPLCPHLVCWLAHEGPVVHGRQRGIAIGGDKAFHPYVFQWGAYHCNSWSENQKQQKFSSLIFGIQGLIQIIKKIKTATKFI